MPQVGFATELSKPELGQPTGASALMNLVRSAWLPIRNLIAELRAFPVTVGRRDEGLVVNAYLPGLQKDEVRVEVFDNMLVIDAEPKPDSGRQFFTAGRRLITLADGAEIEQAKAELKNGILTVLLPMPSAKKKHCHVPVKCSEDTRSQCPQSTLPMT